MAQWVAMLLAFMLFFCPMDAAGLGFRGVFNSFRLSRREEPVFTRDVHLANVSLRSSGSGAGLQAQLRFSDDGAFVVKLAIGIPASNVSLIIDTVDSFVWTDCQPCTTCFQHSPKASAYYSNQSSTFHALPCDSPQCHLLNESFTCTPQCQYNNSFVQDLDSSVAVNTTAFVQDLNLYYLNFTGISVGAILLSIPQATFQYVANSSGTIIVTEIPLTYLPQQAYDTLRKELISQTGLSVYNNSIEDNGLDLCFHWPSDTSKLNIPAITFHFAGADMILPVHNFLPNNGTVACLTMMPTKSNYFVLGSVQQQNFQFIYDLYAETLSFRNFQCDQLPPRERN